MHNTFIYLPSQRTDYIDPVVSIREKKRFVRPPAEKESFREARTRIMTLNHRGKRFLCRWTQCRRSFHLFFPPTFCYTASSLFFPFPFFSFFLFSPPFSPFNLVRLVSFCFSSSRGEKRVTRGRFAQQLEAVGRFFARKIIADSYMLAKLYNIRHWLPFFYLFLFYWIADKYF